MDRRGFLRTSTAAVALGAGGRRVATAGEADWEAFDIAGRDPDANGVILPDGFTSRVVARSNEKVGATDFTWPIFPDGGATFDVDDGWVYVSNSETPNELGGVAAIRFDPRGEIVDAYSILTGTSLNCAGGATPWGTWLSCEEHDAGQVWECEVDRAGNGVARPALGRFKHEAVAVDPDGERLYLTEDVGDGRLYRFTPSAYPDLTDGILEVASVDGSAVTWLPVPDPSAASRPTRHQVRGSTAFDGGEGIVLGDGAVYFTTKGDNRVWRHDLAGATLDVVYDNAVHDGALEGVDNITMTPSGDLLVAEDGGNLELVLVDSAGATRPLARIVDHAHSELAGPAFDSSGTRLYFSSQRGGPGGVGTTFEITGPFGAVPTTTTAVAAGAAASDDGGLPVVVPAVGGAAVLAGAAAVWRLRTRRRS